MSKRRNRVVIFLIGLFLVCPFKAEAWDVAGEISRLVAEAPALVSFSDAGGLVWQRNYSYSLAADGSMTRHQQWLILAGPLGLPTTWRHWSFPVPAGGKTEVHEAGLYDPVSARLVLPLLPVTKEAEGLSVVEVRLPPETADLVLALQVSQTFPRRYNVDDRVWANLDLPLWESEIAVDVPQGAAFAWSTTDAPEPARTTERGRDRYVWRLVNRNAWLGGGLVDEGRPSLAFSLRQGPRSSLEELGLLAAGLNVALPPSLSGAQTNTLRQGERILAFASEESRSRDDLPPAWVRPQEVLSSDGPWTEWERTLVVARWLREIGWNVAIFWQPLAPLDEAVPATRSLWLRPVLSLSAPGLTETFYVPGQQVPLGEMPPEVKGKTLYRLDTGRVLSVGVPGGDALENRLTLNWRLTVDERGVASGDLVVDLFGGWFPLVGTLSSRGIEGIALSGGPFTLGEPEISRRKTGLRATFPVRGSLGIPGTGTLLLQVPGAEPRVFSALRRGRGPLTLRFPFVFEQAFEIVLPEGYAPLDFPTRRNLDSGPVRIAETFRERKKTGAVEGSLRLVVASSSLDDNGAATLAGLVQRSDQWGTLTVPLRKR